MHNSQGSPGDQSCPTGNSIPLSSIKQPGPEKRNNEKKHLRKDKRLSLTSILARRNIISNLHQNVHGCKRESRLAWMGSLIFGLMYHLGPKP